MVNQLEHYAASFGPPVQSDTAVLHVDPTAAGVRVHTDRGTWVGRHLVLATGPGEEVHRPKGLGDCDGGVAVVPASRYRNPGRLPDGGVLVVGASASGVQIADELARSGRRVTLAVGRHTRVPRHYRGMDVFWWLHRTGRLGRTIDQVRDRDAARREPSLQLAGRRAGHGGWSDVDLEALQATGVRLVGNLTSVEDGVAVFRDDLADTVGDAQRRLQALGDSFDRFARSEGLDPLLPPPTGPAPVRLPSARTRIRLAAEGISTVVLATGYRPSYPWLHLPILGPDGRIEQDRGRTRWPGVHVVGQRFQHRRDSSLIDGARYDARLVVDDICASSAAGPVPTPPVHAARSHAVPFPSFAPDEVSHGRADV